MADNLIQKKGESTWYVRLAVAVDVQRAIRCKVLIQSLKNGLRKEAMDVRLPILTKWKAQIANAHAGRQSPADWQQSFVGSLEAVDTLPKWSKGTRIGVDVPLPVPIPSHAEMQEFIQANPELERIMKGLVQTASQEPMGQFKLSDDIGEVFKSALVRRYETRYTPTADQKEEI